MEDYLVSKKKKKKWWSLDKNRKILQTPLEFIYGIISMNF